MAFAQLNTRERLRDIESCVRAVPLELHHLGIHGAISRTSLADANERRDWRIFAVFAQVLIAKARELFAEDTTVPPTKHPFVICHVESIDRRNLDAHTEPIVPKLQRVAAGSDQRHFPENSLSPDFGSSESLPVPSGDQEYKS